MAEYVSIEDMNDDGEYKRAMKGNREKNKSGQLIVVIVIIRDSSQIRSKCRRSSYLITYRHYTRGDSSSFIIVIETRFDVLVYSSDAYNDCSKSTNVVVVRYV